MKKSGILEKDKTVFVMIDIQEKFVPVIPDINRVISAARVLLKASKILGIPLIVTEQYPQGLGKTVSGLDLKDNEVIEKTCFSCFGSKEFSDKLSSYNPQSVVLFGIEAHVCILNTALEALNENLEVHVVADAISSRTAENKQIALERMRYSGVFIDSVELVLFQLLKNAAAKEFSEISKLIK